MKSYPSGRRLSSKTNGLQAHPVDVPGREQILEVLTDEGVPVDENQLAALLKVVHTQWEGFTRRLAAMEREGQVMRNRRGAILIADKAGLIKGRVIGHPDCFGFLKPDDGKDDLFLAPKQMQKVLNCDVVLARVTGVDRRGCLEESAVEGREASSRKVVEAAKKHAKKVAAKDIKDRKDLRSLAFVTIDGETARDFDDAVYCERHGKNFKLWVAIADVSHYVRPGDPIDREAYNRGNSVYFPRRVIPMLPEELSNELCSLKPEVDRLVMGCEMEVTAGGVGRHYEFYPGVIHSHERMTYTKGAAMLQGKEPSRPEIDTAYLVFKALFGARQKRGAIDFESVETQMIFDANGKIERIVRVERNDAHKLIEECMLAANVSASDYLEKNQQPTLFRVHEGPTPEKLEALRAMLKDFALTLGGGDKPQAKDYAELLNRIRDKPYAGMLQTVMLRSLQQAVYTPENVGHFGLAYDAYAHFTSPIRRYPDLLVHRGIKAVLKGQRYEAGDRNAIGKDCSETERRADDATRDVEAWLKSYYMQDHVGEIFTGTISGVTQFGLFVTLDELHVDGLVHISDLGQDYFQYDAAKHMLRGERTGVKYQLAGRVKVKVVRVNLEQAKIDFVLVDEVDMAHVTGRRDSPASGKPRDQDKRMSKIESRHTDGKRKKK